MRPKIIEEAELLEQLLSAFADLGYDGASVRALCRHLGVSHNMVNQRYQSKEAAWYAAVDHAFLKLETVLAPPVASDDPVEGIRELMNRFVDATIAQPALARIIHQEAARPGPRFEYMFTTYIAPFNVRVGEALTILQGMGVVRSGPAVASYFFLNTWGVGGIAAAQDLAARVGTGPVDPVESARLAVDIVLDGLRAPTHPSVNLPATR